MPSDEPMGELMRRRDFLGALGGPAVAWPLPLRAQERTPRVGILLNGDAVVPRDLEIARELARIGYIEGRNVIYDVRGVAGDLSRLPSSRASWWRRSRM